MAKVLIGNIKGPKGDTGATGATGAQGPQGDPGVNSYATTSAAGLMRVGNDFNINSSNGTLSIKDEFTQAGTLAALTSGEAHATLLGKLAKAVSQVITNTSALFRKLLVITDSYADANRGGYTNGFYTVMLTVLGMTDGVDAFLYQKGGAGFVGAGQGKTFGDLLEDAITDMTADERATITDIYVCGGANDKDSAAGTVSNAKDAFYNRARSQFSNAWIHYAMISGFLDYGQRLKLYNISHYAYYYNASRNLDFITNAHLPMCLTESFSGGGDKVHPNATGCKRIGWLLASAFRSKSTMGEFFTRGISQSVTGTPLSGITASDGNPTFRIYTAGTTLQIASITTWHFNGSFTITYNNGLAVYLFSYPLSASGGLVANNGTNMDIPGFGAIPVVAEAYVSSTESITLPGELNIVYDDANQYMKVGFHARTAPKGATATVLRIKPFNHTTVY